jgi:two-component system, NtrC family, nitrogen regulation response regulator GlnG
VNVPTNKHILLVEDDAPLRESIRKFLSQNDFQVATSDCLADATRQLGQASFDLVLLDLTLPDGNGLDLLERFAGQYAHRVVVLTGTASIETAVLAMKKGAHDFLQKPVNPEILLLALQRAFAYIQAQDDCRDLKKEIGAAAGFDKFVFQSHVMADIIRTARQYAATPHSILIAGETGTGKELMAQAIHRLSGRTGPLVSLNIAGLDDTMFSDSLFGHRRGAFTGADTDRGGLIERAEGGTLFLDEIGELSQMSQVKLLRLIEDRRYYPLGADLPKASSAAIVTATNRDLRAASGTGAFRLDLFYRLQTHLVQLPPLRERPSDLPLLLRHFVRQSAERLGRGMPAIPDELSLLLESYDFPGNVRELESMVFDAMSGLKGGVLGLESFRRKILRGTNGKSAPEKLVAGGESSRFSSWERLPTLKQASEELIGEAMRRAKGNQGIASDLLGMSRTALNKRLKNVRDAESEPNKE